VLRKRWFVPKLTTRTAEEVAGLERAGGVVAQALRAATDACIAGATTADVDRAAGEAIRASGAATLFRGYRQGESPPFPADCCVSVNEEVVHGVPSTRMLRSGDVVSIDIGVRLDGWCGDSATTVIVPGGFDPATPASAPDLAARRRLIQTTRDVLDAAVDMMNPGRAWSDIGTELEQLTVNAGYGYVTEYVGHGIGRRLHEPPKAPSYWTGYTGQDFELEEGMVLAIEPLLVLGGSAGRAPVRVAPDNWTVTAGAGSLACHEEYMVAVGTRGARVLSGGGRSAIR
jgi:methionyl aminopeptidase